MPTLEKTHIAQALEALDVLHQQVNLAVAKGELTDADGYAALSPTDDINDVLEGAQLDGEGEGE